MSCEYRQLGDVAIQFIDGDRGKNYPSNNEFSNVGYCLFLNAKNVTPDGFSFGEVSFITQKKDAMLRKGKLEKNDVVLTTRGTVGNVAFYGARVLYSNVRINSGMLIIRPDPSVFCPEYVYWLFRSDVIQDQIKRFRSGTAQPQLPISSIKKFEIPLVDIKTQKKIAAILSALDEKIAINREINENLERQAQSYFQELFVDNADPEWTTGTISDLGAVVGGSTPSKAKPEYYTESGIAWITPKDLSINKSKFVSHGENDITELGLKNSSAAIMPEGTVLFSSRAPIGYIAIAACEVTTNQGFKSVVPKPEIGTPFVYFFLKNTLPVIEGMASGSTFKEVSGSTMKNVPAVIPDAETLAKFSDFCAPIFAQQRILEEQNQSLVMLRDNVLPKLMSGEIDVSAVKL